MTQAPAKPARRTLLRSAVACSAALLSSRAAAEGVGRIVFDGDSVSAGTGASAGMTPDRQLASMLTRPVDVIDVAVPGLPVFKALERFDQAVRPLHRAGAAFNVLAFHAGDNDLAAGRTARETHASFVGYVAAAHAQGWHVVVSTELQRTGWTPPLQDELTAYNRLLLANAAHADAVVDYAGAPGMNDPAQRGNPAYFSPDQLHPSDGGYAVLARMLLSAMRDVLGPEAIG